MLFYPDGQERRMYIYEGPLDAAPVAEAWERWADCCLNSVLQ